METCGKKALRHFYRAEGFHKPLCRPLRIELVEIFCDGIALLEEILQRVLLSCTVHPR